MVQLVPPGTGGVRDFAELLQQRWRACGLPSELLAINPRAAPLPVLQRRPGRLSVLLHYSGYGYQKRGLPLALLQQICSHHSRIEYGGADALRVVVEFQLEVVFFGLGMPGINGHEVAYRLRAEAHTALVVGRLCRPRPTHGRETVCPRNGKVVFRMSCANSKELTMSTQAIDALHDVHTATNDVLKGYREMSARAKPDIQAVIRRLTDMQVAAQQ